MSPLNKIVVLASYSGQGGVEVVTNNLCQGFINHGHEVDLLLVKKRGPHASNIPNMVNQVKFNMSSTWLCLPELIWYLRKNKPAVILAAKHRGVMLALFAKSLAKVETKVVGQIHTNTTATFEKKSPKKRSQRFNQMKRYYPSLDALIGVSAGVLDDIKLITGVLPSHNTALPNALFDDGIHEVALEDVKHPWLINKQIPVIMGAGRLTKQKDFATLISAFALASKQRNLRLILVGDGEEKDELISMIGKLQLNDRVDLVGFQKNLPAWLSRADCFVSSSAWEGLGNVIAEALALGVPIVSTDCISGPRYILEDGKLGQLVPIKDPTALSEAILNRLDAKWPNYEAAAKASANRFHLNNSAESYIKFINSVISS